MLNEQGERDLSLLVLIAVMYSSPAKAMHRKIKTNVRIAKPGQSIQAVSEPPGKTTVAPLPMVNQSQPKKKPSAPEVSFAMTNLDDDASDDSSDDEEKSSTTRAPLLMMDAKKSEAQTLLYPEPAPPSAGAPTTATAAPALAMAALQEDEEDLFHIKSTLLDDLSPVPPVPVTQSNREDASRQKGEMVLQDAVAEQLIAKLEVLFCALVCHARSE